jgi:acyl carrier protein
MICRKSQTCHTVGAMGLDGVEIVMKVEETFDIVIEDSEAEKLVTPGLLIELVLSKVGRTAHAACLTQRAFHRLRTSLMRQLGFKRKQIRPETSLASLFPRSTRKERIRQILTDIGLRRDIEFVRPNWLHQLIVLAMFAGAIATAIFLAWHPIPSKSFLINLVLGSPIIAGVLFLAIFGWGAFFATRWMRIEFRPSLATVGHLSRWIVANAPDVVNAPPGEWSHEQVSAKIRQIVIEHLGCEQTYREDAHFIKDLGMG